MRVTLSVCVYECMRSRGKILRFKNTVIIINTIIIVVIIIIIIQGSVNSSVV